MTRIDLATAAPAYPSLGLFVTCRLSEVFARQVADTNERVWCPRWWLHPEALERLWILWRTWEQKAARGPAGMSSWWLDDCEPHMNALLDPGGPFRFCGVRHGHKDLLAPLPTDLADAPPELFTPAPAAVPAPGR